MPVCHMKDLKKNYALFIKQKNITVVIGGNISQTKTISDSVHFRYFNTSIYS